MLQSRGDAAFGIDGAEKVRHLLAQRERLLGEIQSEEREEMAELGEGRRRIAHAEALEKEHREAVCEEQSKNKQAEHHMAWPNATRAAGALAAAASSALLGGVAPVPAVLFEEVRSAREELGTVRSVRSVLAESKAASEKQRLEDWINAIRAGSQENQALQANQQMAQAHLKALEAMAASSSAQVRVREGALQGLLKQLEDQESAALEMRERAEVAEMQLEASVTELRSHEAVSSPSSWVSVQIAEHEELKREREVLLSEAQQLKQEHARAQGHLDSGRRNLFPDDGLHSSVEQLRRACEAATIASRDHLCKPSMLQAEVARLSTELLAEQHVVDELSELQGSMRGVSRRLENGGTHDQLATEEEEEALISELAQREADCNRLRVEAAERDEQFSTITRDLQEQIDSLRAEEREEEIRAQHATSLNFGNQASPLASLGLPPLHRPSPHPSPAAAWACPATAMASSSASTGMSAPPGALVDPGRGSEPPPRRMSRPEIPAAFGTSLAARQSEDFAGPSSAGVAAYGDSRGPVLWSREPRLQAPGAHDPLPSQTGMGQTQAYWDDFERSRRAASHSPAPGSRHLLQADHGATLLIPALVPGGARPELGATVTNASWLGGASDSSHLFHTHNASISPLDAHSFRTPPSGPAYHASPMATTQRRGVAGLGAPWQFDALPRSGMEPMVESWQQGGAAATGSSPPRRARTPPPRPPSMPADLLHGGGHGDEWPPRMCPAAALARQATAATAFGTGRAPSPQPVPLTMHAINQAEMQVMPMAAHFANARERRSAFQARISELKGVIGASLQSLDEDEAADSQRWSAARAGALADREQALWGLQNTAAQELAAATAAAVRGLSAGGATHEFW